MRNDDELLCRGGNRSHKRWYAERPVEGRPSCWWRARGWGEGGVRWRGGDGSRGCGAEGRGSERRRPMVVVEVSIGCCPGPLTLLGPLGYCPPYALESRFHSVRRIHHRDYFSSSFLFVSTPPLSIIPVFPRHFLSGRDIRLITLSGYDQTSFVVQSVLVAGDDCCSR